jgi:hypothetical protein
MEDPDQLDTLGVLPEDHHVADEDASGVEQDPAYEMELFRHVHVLVKGSDFVNHVLAC